MSTPDTMLGGWQALAAIVVMALITFALRALPFVAAGLLNRFRAIRTLGRFLPPAILGLLLIHTMGGFIQNDASTVGAWPSLAALAVTVVVQLASRHALLSILAGTGLYVVLRNASVLFQ